jgi:hypothetical protein
VALGDGASGSGFRSPPPAVGATLIAGSLVVLVVGIGWLSRSEGAPTENVSPAVDGVTEPTDRDGDTVEIPPSQPAVAVSFGPGGEILRPDPVRARIIDETGAEVLVTLPPDTMVDMVTGAIVRRTTTTTRPRGTTAPGATTPPPTKGPGTTVPGTTPTTSDTTIPDTTPTTSDTTIPDTTPTTSDTTIPDTTSTTSEPPPEPTDSSIGYLLP